MHHLLESLITARMRLGLSQREVSEKIGTPRESINRIEREKQGLSLDNASAWATACGAHLILIRDGEELAGLDEEERALVEGYRDLDGTRRQLLLDLARVAGRMDLMVLELLRSQVAVLAKSSASARAIADSDRAFPKEG